MIKKTTKKAVSAVVGGVTCVNGQGKTQVFVAREFCPSGWTKKSSPGHPTTGGGGSSK